MKNDSQREKRGHKDIQRQSVHVYAVYCSICVYVCVLSYCKTMTYKDKAMSMAIDLDIWFSDLHMS